MSYLTLVAPQSAPMDTGATPSEIATLRISARALQLDRKAPKVKWLDETTASIKSRRDKSVHYIIRLNRDNPLLSLCSCSGCVDGHYLCFHIIRAALSYLRRKDPTIYRSLLKKWRAA